MKEPVDHVARPSLPWRHGPGITECGLDVEGARSITRDEYRQRVKDLGSQRASMFTCMTCANTADRWHSWESDPRVVIYREIEWERGTAYYHSRDDRGHLLKDELLAMAALVEAHREEFDDHLKATEARREWLEKKAALGAKPKPPTRSL